MPLRASTSILLTRGARRRAGRGRGRGPYSVAVAPWVSGVKRQSTSNPISHRRSCVPTQHSTARGGRRQSSAVKSSEKMRGEKNPTAVSRFTSAGAPDSAGRAKGRGQDRRAGTARPRVAAAAAAWFHPSSSPSVGDSAEAQHQQQAAGEATSSDSEASVVLSQRLKAKA
jgi:hypothetical protein